MINRNYLPYKSAREYVDRGMAKWMGFFISEHTSAINNQDNIIDFSDKQSEGQKRLLLTQLFFQEQIAQYYLINRKQSIIGKVYDFQHDLIYIKSSEGILQIQIQDILKINLIEEIQNE